jgi:hypothetical protein
VVAGLTAAITAALGLSLATAGPAAATESGTRTQGLAVAEASGTWRAYGNTNPITSSTSTWKCGSSTTVATNVIAQVCAIRSSSGSSV